MIPLFHCVLVADTRCIIANVHCMHIGMILVSVAEMWLSLLHHVVSTHSWTGGVKFHQCAHEERQGEEMCTIYLDKDSLAFAALKSVVASPFLLRALPQLTQYCHTGDLEVYHSYLLKYCPKRQHFFYEGKSE